MMKLIVLVTLVAKVSSFINSKHYCVSKIPRLYMSDNSNMFGGETKTTIKKTEVSSNSTPPPTPVVKGRQSQKYEDQAALLRQEAADMEISMREEARAKGLPEEMINKLVPLPRQENFNS